MNAVALNVTPAIIESSLRKSMVLNPITKAARKALKRTGLHTFDGKLWQAATVLAPLPTEAVEFLAAYDRGETVLPTTIHMGFADGIALDEYTEAADPDCDA